MRRSTKWWAPLLAALMVTVFAAPAYADHATRTDVSNITNHGDVPSGDLDGEVEPADSTFNTDIAWWGNTAYQGNYNGFRIIDVTNKEAPVLLNRTECNGSQGDVMIWENLLFRSWDSPVGAGGNTCDGTPLVSGEEGIHAFDVSNPADPVVIDFIDLVSGSHTATLVPDVANDKLYIYNGPSATGAGSGIDIVEVELEDDPTTVDTNERGQMTLVRRENTNRSCHDTAVYLGDVLKAVCAGGNGFTVLSMDPDDGGSLTNPAFMYSRAIQDVTIGHAATFANDGETFVFGHEPGGGSQASCEDGDPDSFRTFFFYDTATGTEQGKWEIPVQGATENCTPHNLNVIPTTDGSDIMVSGNYQAGTWVTDFTDPKEPFVVAHSDPPPLSPTSLILGGAWSTYWYNGYLYETDITKGLHIMSLTNSASEATAQDLPYLNPQTQMERPAQSTTSASSVTIAHSDSPHRFSGKVSSDDAGCVAGRKVTVRKAQDGRDRWIGAATTGSQGGYNVAHKRGGAGRYYAVVQKSTVQDGIDTTTCQWGDSDRIRVSS